MTLARRAALLLPILGLLAFAATPVVSQPSRTPVLVELFTSEGCSSCPPADALLARLQRDQPVPAAQILVLEEHVDYWDSLGWHDRFSSYRLTERQSAYVQHLHLDSPYTPQMVVDGADQFTGNDSTRALRSIAQAARTAKPVLTLSKPTTNSGRISASVSATSTTNLPKSDLYAALVQTAATTQVGRGENGGRTLHHVSILRALQKIGPSTSLTSPISFSLDAPKDVSPADLRVMVFAQQPGPGAIVAAVLSQP